MELTSLRKLNWDREILLQPRGSCASLVVQMVKNLPAMQGEPYSIPGSERSLGEGIGYSLQKSWVSLVAQRVKNPPAVQETWVRSLCREDPLEEGMATLSSILSILAWRIPMDRGTWRGCKELDTTE